MEHVSIIYKYILLVRVICEKYRLRGEANLPSHLNSEGTGDGEKAEKN
jgi:hypothetical protein